MTLSSSTVNQRRLTSAATAVLLAFGVWCRAADVVDQSFGFSAGPLLHRFQLTLTPGTKTEALGPMFGFQQEEGRREWAIPPLFSYVQDRDTDSAEFDFGYPLLTWDRFGPEYRFQILQLFSLSGGENEQQKENRRTT